MPQFKDKLAIIEVEITTTKLLKHPVLIIKDDKGVNIRPLGSWTGWYTSKELENAEKFGYTYKIKRGYLFDSAKPFIDYVETIYKIRINNAKGTPLNLIAKLLLNSLYGRFGISPLNYETVITDIINLDMYINKFSVIDVIELDNSKVLIQYTAYENDEDYFKVNRTTDKSISLPISIFTTSYARILISQFINKDDLELYYTDTDSLDFKGALTPELLGDWLGQFKFEALFKRVVYLAPKLYFTEFEVNNELIKKNKTRGLKNSKSLSLDEAKDLLKKDSLKKINQEKWFRDISLSKITIKIQTFEVKTIKDKRKPIYDDNNVWVETEPLTIQPKS